MYGIRLTFNLIANNEADIIVSLPAGILINIINTHKETPIGRRRYKRMENYHL